MSDTREQWLNRAVGFCRAHLADRAQIDLPTAVRVSCGFPGGRGSSRKTIGQCWPAELSADATREMFISPTLSVVREILATLLHECIHAALPANVGHKGPFKRAAIAAGLEGKMTATVASATLVPTLDSWSATLGAYPGAALSLAGRVVQSTRLIKVECPCGCVARITRKWLDQVGEPTCGCGGLMVANI